MPRSSRRRAASTGGASSPGSPARREACSFDHPWAVPLFSRPLAGAHGHALAQALEANLRTAGFSKSEAAELHDQLSNLVFALVAPELRGKRNRAAFERGLELLHAGLETRLRQQ